MNEILFEINIAQIHVAVTWWKIIGYLGVICFAGRWVVQVIDSYKKKAPSFPLLFWLMSMSGSVLVLSYFIFGKNDSVGIFSNSFPVVVAGYNLLLHLKQGTRP